MRNRSGIILIEDDKLALIERYRTGLHYFIFPGGGIDEGESPSKPLSARRRKSWGSSLR